MTFEFEPKPEGLLLEVLTLLQEEAAEVIQAVSKLKRFGVTLENIQSLQKEMIDFTVISTILQHTIPEKLDLSPENSDEYTNNKLNKLKIYTEHIKYLIKDSE